MTAYPEVAQAAVAAHGSGGDRHLVGYLVPTRAGSAEELLVAGLREHLQHTLPAQLVPSALVVLDHIPMTVSGKIDRQALPQIRGRQAGERPGTDNCAGTVAVRAVRRGPRPDAVGIDEDFFDLGGHSIRAARLVARIRAVLGAELPLAAVFECPSAGRSSPPGWRCRADQRTSRPQLLGRTPTRSAGCWPSGSAPRRPRPNPSGSSTPAAGCAGRTWASPRCCRPTGRSTGSRPAASRRRGATDLDRRGRRGLHQPNPRDPAGGPVSPGRVFDRWHAGARDCRPAAAGRTAGGAARAAGQRTGRHARPRIGTDPGRPSPVLPRAPRRQRRGPGLRALLDKAVELVHNLTSLMPDFGSPVYHGDALLFRAGRGRRLTATGVLARARHRSRARIALPAVHAELCQPETATEICRVLSEHLAQPRTGDHP